MNRVAASLAPEDTESCLRELERLAPRIGLAEVRLTPRWPTWRTTSCASSRGVHRLTTKQEARGFCAQAFAAMPLIRITSQRRLYGPGFAIDEASVEAVTANGEPTGFQPLHVFEFADGQTSRQSAWQAPRLQ